jgi:hypothetical protein
VEDLDAQYDTVRTEAGVFQALKSYDEASGTSRDGDTGHEFSTVLRTVELSRPSVFVSSVLDQSDPTRWSYTGPLIPASSSWHYGQWVDPWVPVDLTAQGTRAIAACAPTHPGAAGLVALAEGYRDGLPHLVGHTLWKERTSAARKLGEEHLNYQFGWLPLASDIRNVLKSVAHHGNIVRQLKRDSGRLVRRSFSFPTQRASQSFSGTGSLMTVRNTTFMNSGIFKGPLGTPVGPLLCTTTLERDMWFKGQFEYYIPSGDSAADYVDRKGAEAEKLLGLELTPEVVWKAQPWSWLVDWQYNIGSVMTNVSRLQEDGLVMRYGYLMCRETTRNVVTVSGCKSTLGSAIGPVSVTFTQVKKTRTRANPFGFGSAGLALTARRVSILAAIGLTR